MKNSDSNRPLVSFQTYRWENIEGYDRDTLDKLKEIIESTAHLIIEFAQEGGFANAANL